MSATPVFALQEVSFAYEQIPALRGVSLTIGGGQSVALVGANGSGKSTLLRLLDALCFPTLVPSVFAASPSRRKDYGTTISFCPSAVVLRWFSESRCAAVQPNSLRRSGLWPAANGLVGSEVTERVNSALEQMGIVHLRDRSPYRLSGGEKKRVALASVLVLDPEVLLLDEPTAMLDPRSQSQLIDLIQNWKGSTKTIVTATHQLEIVEDIAEQIVVLEQGMQSLPPERRTKFCRTMNCYCEPTWSTPTAIGTATSPTLTRIFIPR